MNIKIKFNTDNLYKDFNEAANSAGAKIAESVINQKPEKVSEMPEVHVFIPKEKIKNESALF